MINIIGRVEHQIGLRSILVAGESMTISFLWIVFNKSFLHFKEPKLPSKNSHLPQKVKVQNHMKQKIKITE